MSSTASTACFSFGLGRWEGGLGGGGGTVTGSGVGIISILSLSKHSGVLHKRVRVEKKDAV